MLQQDESDNYVLATDESHSVRKFVELAFAEIDRTIEWRGKGENETGVDAKSGETLVRVDPNYCRPTEIDSLCGDAGKARTKLGWKPSRSFDDLVRGMVQSDIGAIESKRGV